MYYGVGEKNRNTPDFVFFYENGFRSIVRSIIVHVVSIELLTSSYLDPTHWEIEAVGYLGGRLQRISLSGG